MKKRTSHSITDKPDYPSYRTRVFILITLILFIAIIGISGITYHFTLGQVMSEFHNSRLQVEKTFVSSAILTEYGIESFDAQYDFLLRDRIGTFLTQYEKCRSNLTDLDLPALKEQFSSGVPGDIELYMINASGVIRYTTYPKDYLADFSQYPDFFSSLTRIRLGDEFISDPWIRDFSDPAVYWKYGYHPTDDHEYILEIGLRNENYSQMHTKMIADLRNISGTALNAQDLVYEVIYDKALRSRTLRIQDEDQNISSVTGLLSDDVLRERINQTFIAKRSENIDNPSRHQIISLQYIDLSPTQSASGAERSYVGILVFSTERREQTIILYTIGFIVATIISLVSGLVIARYLAGYISKPIEMMTEDVGIIASTTLNHSVRETGVYETEQLRLSINRMIQSIRQYIGEIQEQSEALSSELTKRSIAETSLARVNKRLIQLSQITRHDILNQLTALQFYLDEISESGGKTEVTSYTEKAYRALEQIIMLLRFTLDYERIGQDGLIWQNIGTILDKHREEFTGQITISHSCGNLEILADPLIRKVIYNLIDNTIRHGDSADQIHVSFIEQEGQGLLIYTDDGAGIPENDKERIFVRGFGRGSGLGMSFIREVLESDGMQITETGVAGRGVRFEITVPKENFLIGEQE